MKLHLGDCIDIMAEMSDASVDAIVTDPPYGLEFMGREWDTFKQAPRRVAGTGGSEAPFAHHAVELSPERNRAFQSWCEAWSRECLRVLKPGGHMLAFGGTRTYHRLVCAVEDAGFEIRDSLHWIYGSGFPKSLDVSKAIDKMAGARREVVGRRGGGSAGSAGGILNMNGRDMLHGSARDSRAVDVTAPATEDAARWDGWGTALKPAHEPIVVARKPLTGTVAANVLAHGTGALNVDGCRVAHVNGENPSAARRASAPPVREAGSWANDRRSAETYTAERPGEAAGRWPPNILLTHSADCNGDCSPGCPVAEMDAQSGHLVGCGGPKRTDSGDTSIFGIGQPGRTYERDGGGASRFFPCFRYEAKAPARERPKLADGTAWPTVKPLDLMRWLVRLVTPPGGTVLDPFAGTGTTGEAAALEGFQCVLIERDPVAAELTLQRLRKPSSPMLFDAI